MSASCHSFKEILFILKFLKNTFEIEHHLLKSQNLGFQCMNADILELTALPK
jgi:hypothetical protein